MFGRRLSTLFIDIDAFFAQVEQRVQPRLRRMPVGIVPVVAETTCCIATSYEAKKCGVKTGTSVAEARRLCPAIQLVPSRPELYIRFHHRILQAVDTCIPVDRVLSIDEMSCRLAANERSPQQAASLAHRVKGAILQSVGLTSSIGVAPNEALAKVASEMEKPDGLVVLRPEELPQRLFTLELDDLPGIGKRMLARLHGRGIRTMEELCAQSEGTLAEIWGSIEGRRWWRRLHGYDVPPVQTRRRSIGHQRILAPERRTSEAARSVLIHLICKAAARARREGYYASRLTIGVRYLPNGGWRRLISFKPTQDTGVFIGAMLEVWPGALPATPLRLDATLHDLLPAACVEAPLFQHEHRSLELWRTIDRINARHGKQVVHLAAMHDSLDAVPVRIPFNFIPDLDLPA